MPEQENPTPIKDIIIPDFNNNKITQYQGINDEPIAPTNTSGSNISHAHDEHNKLVDSVISGHTELRKAIQKNANDIDDNYSYLYNRIDNYYSYNRTDINDLYTITGNNTSNISTNAGLLNQTNDKIAAVANYLFRGQTDFIFDNVNVAVVDPVGKSSTLTMPKGGILRFVYFSDLETNNYPTIYVDDNTVYSSHNSSTEPNYLYEIDLSYSFFVEIGSKLKITLPTTYNIASVKVKIE